MTNAGVLRDRGRIIQEKWHREAVVVYRQRRKDDNPTAKNDAPSAR
jgi:hypothetical protein